MNYTYTGSLLSKTKKAVDKKRTINCDCLYTVGQASKKLKESTQYVSIKRMDGVLTAVRLSGKSFRYPESELNNYIKNKPVIPEFDYDFKVEINCNEYLQPEEVAKILNVDIRSINRYCIDGKLIRLWFNSKSVYIPKQSVINFLQNCITENMQSVESELI